MTDPWILALGWQDSGSSWIGTTLLLLAGTILDTSRPTPSPTFLFPLKLLSATWWMLPIRLVRSPAAVVVVGDDDAESSELSSAYARLSTPRGPISLFADVV
jgi:hypothetical protein